MIGIILGLVFLPNFYVSGCGPQIETLLEDFNQIQTSNVIGVASVSSGVDGPSLLPAASGEEMSFPNGRYIRNPTVGWVIPRRTADGQLTIQLYGKRLFPREKSDGNDLRRSDTDNIVGSHEGSAEPTYEGAGKRRVKFAPEITHEPAESRYNYGAGRDGVEDVSQPGPYQPSEKNREGGRERRSNPRRFLRDPNDEERSENYQGPRGAQTARPNANMGDPRSGYGERTGERIRDTTYDILGEVLENPYQPRPSPRDASWTGGRRQNPSWDNGAAGELQLNEMLMVPQDEGYRRAQNPRQNERSGYGQQERPRRPAEVTDNTYPGVEARPTTVDPIDNDDPYTWVTPQTRLDSMPKNVVVPFTLFEDTYIGFLLMGTPAFGQPEQKLKVKFDTGISSVWAVSKEACDNQLCREINVPYDKGMSTSYKPLNVFIQDFFPGQCIVSGKAAKEDFILGSGEDSLIVREQLFGEATLFRVVFDEYDVLFGLNWQHPSVTNGKADAPLLTMLRQFGAVPEFSIYFSRYYTQGSFIIFAAEEDSDKKFFVGDFSSHPIVKVNVEGIGPVYNGWNIALDGFVVEQPNTEPTWYPAPQTFHAKINTGHQYISGPEHLIRKLNNDIFKNFPFPVDEYFSYDCSLDVRHVWLSQPHVSIIMNGVKYVFAPDDYMDTTNGICRTVFRAAESADYLVLGYPFITKFYTKFDFANLQVRIAVAKQPPHLIADLHDTIRQLHQGPEKVRIR